jgi:hypothetical protein
VLWLFCNIILIIQIILCVTLSRFDSSENYCASFILNAGGTSDLELFPYGGQIKFFFYIDSFTQMNPMLALFYNKRRKKSTGAENSQSRLLLLFK